MLKLGENSSFIDVDFLFILQQGLQLLSPEYMHIIQFY